MCEKLSEYVSEYNSVLDKLVKLQEMFPSKREEAVQIMDILAEKKKIITKLDSEI